MTPTEFPRQKAQEALQKRLGSLVLCEDIIYAMAKVALNAEVRQRFLYEIARKPPGQHNVTMFRIDFLTMKELEYLIDMELARAKRFQEASKKPVAVSAAGVVRAHLGTRRRGGGVSMASIMALLVPRSSPKDSPKPESVRAGRRGRRRSPPELPRLSEATCPPPDAGR